MCQVVVSIGDLGFSVIEAEIPFRVPPILDIVRNEVTDEIQQGGLYASVEELVKGNKTKRKYLLFTLSVKKHTNKGVTYRSGRGPGAWL